MKKNIIKLFGLGVTIIFFLIAVQPAIASDIQISVDGDLINNEDLVEIGDTPIELHLGPITWLAIGLAVGVVYDAAMDAAEDACEESGYNEKDIDHAEKAKKLLEMMEDDC